MKLYPLLKDFQKHLVDKNLELIKSVITENKKIIGRQVSVSPTGSGKTFMMASIIESGLKLPEEPAFIWLTHNKQILYQTENEIINSLGGTVTSVRSIEENIQSYGGKVLLFNVQKGVSKKSLIWLQKWKKYHNEVERPIFFIIDEADEGMSGKNMGELIKVLQPKLELGFTASFKKKEGEYLFYKVPYQEVIKAGMLVKRIEYQASDEVNRYEMMERAIKHREYLESLTHCLQSIGRYFTPKMLIQTQASEAENVARELFQFLKLNKEDFNKQVVIHVQSSRGLEQVEDMDDVRYIIGDLMIERGWNCPEAYVLLSTKDSVSEAKGIQLLGRIIRLPKAEPFDEEFDFFNCGYVFISGKHSIEKSCEKFLDQDVNPLPPPKEVTHVEKRGDIIVPEIVTFVDELDKDLEDRDLRPITDSLCNTLEEIKNQCDVTDPSIRIGELQLQEGAVTKNPDEKTESEWNIEHTKKILIDALTKHCPRGYANLVITNFQIRKKEEGGLNSVAPFAKQMSKKIKESTLIRRICENLEYVHEIYKWPPHKLVIVQPAPLKCDYSLYPKMQLNSQERKFASYLDNICKKNGFYFVRNDRTDIKIVKSHYPDFIVFKDNKYIFIEFKGKHLLDTVETIRKNIVSQKAAEYYLVFLDEDLNKFMVLGRPDEKNEEFTENHIKSLLS